MEIKSITTHSIELSNEELTQLTTLLDLAKNTRSMPNNLVQLANNLIEAAKLALDTSSTSSSVVKKNQILPLMNTEPTEYKIDDYTIKLVDDFTNKIKKNQEDEVQITFNKPLIDTTE